MKRMIFVAFMLIAGASFGFTVKGNTIELTADEAKNCQAEGGCVVTTNAFLAAVLEHIETLQKKIGKSCI